MNEHIEQHLSTIVDAVVRPVWATPRRKRMIREELLAHVCAVFEEEVALLGNERAAVEATCARFGAADDLGHQLQSSVPLLGDWFFLFEKEHPMARWFWILAAFAIAVGPAIILPAAAKYGHERDFLAFPFVLGGVILLGGLGMVGYGIAQRFNRAS